MYLLKGLICVTMVGLFIGSFYMMYYYREMILKLVDVI